MIFWIPAALLSLGAIAWAVFPLLRPKASKVTRSAYDVQVYKDQLKEVETDLARGTLSEEEAKASRTEVSRRLLAAADAESHEKLAGNAPRGVSMALALVVVLASIGGGAVLYYREGAPGYPDQPFTARQEAAANRPSQEEAEKLAEEARAQDASLPDIQQPDPRQISLVQQLQDVLKDRPNDLKGHRMLAENMSQLGKYIEARKAQQDVMRILGDQATADDYATLAEYLIVAAGYYVSPEAEDALGKALKLDQGNPRALYYAGIAMLQQNRPEVTYQIWDQLLKDSPPDAPWVPVIESQMDAVAAAAGIDRNAPGPSAGDVAAAQDMTASERADMINSMIAQLEERLYSEGGSAAEWARLINAYGVQGKADKASEAYAKAQQALAGDSAALETVKQAAVKAGVVQE